jgi:fumarylacetoacetase
VFDNRTLLSRYCTDMTSWLDLDETDPFGLQTLPYGVFSTADQLDRPDRRVGVRIGSFVLDAAAAAERAGMESGETWAGPSLNPFLARGPQAWAAARDWLTTVLSDEAYRDAVEPHLHPLDTVTLHLPFEVADYVDFYASEHHATNLGAIFRPDNPTLPAAWKHLPIGYHGRAGTVVVSGTDVVRPNGQQPHPEGGHPPFGPSTRLDIEAEVGFVVGGATPMGMPVPLAEAGDHLFGVVLLNDWSARDLQAWEYVPLGPFLGKSFATSISAWVTPMAALAEARVHLLDQDPRPHDYLHHETDRGLDLHLEVTLNGTVVSRPEYRHMYWSPEQMLAHLTVNGASLRDGDLFGSGTVSGDEPGTLGSLVELTQNAARPLTLDDGTTRGFLEDGDVVAMTAWAPGPRGTRVGVAEVTGRVAPAPQVSGS